MNRRRGVFSILKRIAICLIFVPLVWSALTASSLSQNVGSFEFSDWDGPAINVHYVEPDGSPADAPIVFVMHGVQRNADGYRDNWIKLAQEYGFAVYAPEFDAKRFPRALNYNLGAVGTDQPSAFASIEPLFDTIKQRRNAPQDSYVIFGHSAGAQFVHRFVYFAQDARFSLAIAANAGWYTLPTVDQEWPYGLGGDEAKGVDLKSIFTLPLLVMLGDEDNDPNARSLRKSRQANFQGRHRLARGETFLNTAIKSAEEINATLNWKYVLVEGVGHENDKMAKAAAPIIASGVN